MTIDITPVQPLTLPGHAYSIVDPPLEGRASASRSSVGFCRPSFSRVIVVIKDPPDRRLFEILIALVAPYE